MVKNLFIIFSLIALTSCAQKNNNTINVTEFDKGIQNNNVQILDVRTAAEFRSGHIKNALQANYNNTQEFKERTQHLDKNKPIYIYCLSGVRSAYAMEDLKAMGFNNLYHLKGGINAWKQNNKPVEGATTTTQMTELEYQQFIAKNGIVLVDFGADWCPPCVKMKPIITEVLNKNAAVKLLNVDGGRDLHLMEKQKVEVLPVFIIYKNGKEVWRKQGIVSAEELTKYLTQ